MVKVITFCIIAKERELYIISIMKKITDCFKQSVIFFYYSLTCKVTVVGHINQYLILKKQTA